MATVEVRWKMITGAGAHLFGLDNRGEVYKYIPAADNHFAFWTRLTNRKLENRGKDKKKSDQTEAFSRDKETQTQGGQCGGAK